MTPLSRKVKIKAIKKKEERKIIMIMPYLSFNGNCEEAFCGMQRFSEEAFSIYLNMVICLQIPI